MMLAGWNPLKPSGYLFNVHSSCSLPLGDLMQKAIDHVPKENQVMRVRKKRSSQKGDVQYFYVECGKFKL